MVKTILKSEDAALCVARIAREKGFEARLEMCARAGALAYRVAVDCLPADLKAITREARARRRARAVWQGYCAPPNDAYTWGLHFASYVRTRWFDSKHPGAPYFRDLQGPGAFAKDLEPLAGPSEPGTKKVYDLSSPSVWRVFLEYLSEYPERRVAWRAFERKHGPCEAL